MIGMQEARGIRAIACHWNGAPAQNGALLTHHYTDPAKIAALLDLGDISCLGAELGERHVWEFGGATYPQTVTAYGRDRHDRERDVAARTCWDRLHLVRTARQETCRYVYLFADRAWWYLDLFQRNHEWRLLCSSDSTS